MSQKSKKSKKKEIEITGSFSFKLNLQNHLTFEEQQELNRRQMGVAYENQDWFLSAKGFYPKSKMEEGAAELHEFCKKVVVGSVNKYIAEIRNLVKVVDNKKINDTAKTDSELDAGITDLGE